MTMRPFPRRFAVQSALALTLTLGATAQRCDEGALDILDRAIAVGTDTAGGEKIVVVPWPSLTELPTLRIFELQPGTVDVLGSELVPPSGPSPTWRISGASIQGDRIALAGGDTFQAGQELVVHERSLLGWSTWRAPLPGYRWRAGDRVALDGARIAVATAESWWQPITVHIYEPSPAGGWSAVAAVLTDALAPWIEDPLDVVHDEGVVAVADSSGAGIGRVVVCERDLNGVWSQTVRLDPPGPVEWGVEALALHDGALAVLRRRGAGTAMGVEQALHVYERRALGDWVLTGRADVTRAIQSNVTFGLAIDARRVALSRGGRAETFLRGLTGALVPEHSIDSDREVRGLLGDRVVLASTFQRRSAANVLRLPSASAPGPLESCWLRGLTTCPGTGAARLRVHDRWFGATERRAAAELVDAPPGATALLWRSPEPGLIPALGGLLCIDRPNATLVGAPRSVDASGTVTFALPASSTETFGGLFAADHLQAVLLASGNATLSNAIAWLP